MTEEQIDLDASVITPENESRVLTRPNHQRAQLAIIMIYVVMLIDGISFLSSTMQLELLYQIQDGVSLQEDVISNNDLREQIVGIVYLIAFVFSVVVFIKWFRRAYYNLHIRTRNCEHTEGWAAGCWFVPILSLFRPFQIMVEMWEKTTNLIATQKNILLSKSKAIISIWWALWLVSNYLGKYILKKAFNSVTVDDLVDQTIISMVDCSISIVLAIVTIMMIRAYATREAMLDDCV